MSNLIKSDNVVLDKPMSLDASPCAVMSPRVLKKPAKVHGKQQDCASPPVGQPLNDEQSRRENILNHVKFESKEIYEQSRKQGVADGFAKGLEQGARDGEKNIQSAENAAVAAIEQLITETAEEYQKTQAEVESETLDFTFALASKILNMHIDRDDPRFLNLFDRINETDAPGIETDGIEQVAQTIVFAEVVGADNDMDAKSPDRILIASALAEDEGSYPGLEDVLLLEESDRRRLMDSVDIRDLVMAFKGTDESVMQAVMSGFPERMRDTLREELNLYGPVLLSDVEKARGRIGLVMHLMQKAGQIERGGERKDDIFV